MKHLLVNATLLQTIKLLGTELILKAGDRVIAIPALNLPDTTQFFVSHPDWNHDDSILVTKDEVEIDHFSQTKDT
jgi:hypothetical protein